MGFAKAVVASVLALVGMTNLLFLCAKKRRKPSAVELAAEPVLPDHPGVTLEALAAALGQATRAGYAAELELRGTGGQRSGRAKTEAAVLRKTLAGAAGGGAAGGPPPTRC